MKRGNGTNCIDGSKKKKVCNIYHHACNEIRTVKRIQNWNGERELMREWKGIEEKKRRGEKEKRERGRGDTGIGREGKNERKWKGE